MKSVTKKAAKVVAAALKAVTDGGKYLKDAVKRILDDEPGSENGEAAAVDGQGDVPAGEESV